MPFSPPDDHADTPSSLHPWLKLALTLALLGALTWSGFVLKPPAGDSATIWPANGVLLALLLTSRARERMLWLLTGMLAYAACAALDGLPASASLRIALVNGGELLVTWQLLRRYSCGDAELSSPLGLWRFTLAAAILVPAGFTVVTALFTQNLTLPFMASVFLAHGLGIITIAPLVLEARRGGFRLMRHANALKCTAAFGALAGVTFMVFWQTHYPLLFLVLPPLVLVTALGGLPSAALGLFFITSISTGLTMLGHGPEALMFAASQGQKLLMLQGFLAVAAGMALVLAVIQAERDRAEAALRAAKRELERLATTDPLTGLANRRRMDEFLDHEFRRAMRQNTPLAVVLVDVDLFKLYNDHYGHQQGDACLRAVADVLKNHTRRPGDLACRYGGEEFALILNAEAHGACFLAKAVRKAVEALQIPHAANTERGGVVTVSIGVATLTPHKSHASVAELLREADRLLYAAKRKGRNCVLANTCTLKRQACRDLACAV